MLKHIKEKLDPNQQISKLSVGRVHGLGGNAHSSPQDAGSEFYRSPTSV